MKEHEKLLKAIRDEIERSVNGGIRAVREAQIKSDEKLSDYIKDDTAWKKRNEPALENMKNLTTGWKIILAFFASVAVISGGIIGVKKLLGL